MRKLFLVLAIVFTILGTMFAFLPLDTIALAPLFLGAIFGVISYLKSDETKRKTVKIIFIFAIIATIVVVSKHFLLTDEVTVDKNFEKAKIESQKEAQKTLENDLE